jgi:hypothetical protein
MQRRRQIAALGWFPDGGAPDATLAHVRAAILTLALLQLTPLRAELGGVAIDERGLPAPARAAIERQAAGRPIVSLTARAGPGAEVVYEADVRGPTANVVIAVDGRGQSRGRFILPRAVGVEGR